MGENKSASATVLIVEEYEDPRLAMRLALEQYGYRVIEAGDGQAAVEVAARERPAVILMDITLPVLDGPAAAKLIREDEGTRDTIIVAITAHNEAQYRTAALAAGYNAYVTKPIDFYWLNGLLASLLK
ncbi:MAG: response regulator [Pyrinomonadaceae bacterium]|nr:response regulator [Pyrinomonadaceae bacterium]